MPDVLVRAPARLWRVVDGDTYDLVVNWKRRYDWRGAAVARVRLRDYSARERFDTAASDPKGAGRVSGPTATAIAQATLEQAKEVLVELQGIDAEGRDVCWVWIDGQSLGEQLLAQHAVMAGKTEG